MWGKRRDMTVRDRLPFNAEPPAAVLAGGELTALDAFYCRNHGPFPDITREQWRLTVDGMVQKPLTLTYDELTSQFTPHSVVATLACAGNRRAELLKVRGAGVTTRHAGAHGYHRLPVPAPAPPGCPTAAVPTAVPSPVTAPSPVVAVPVGVHDRRCGSDHSGLRGRGFGHGRRCSSNSYSGGPGRQR